MVAAPSGKAATTILREAYSTPRGKFPDKHILSLLLLVLLKTVGLFPASILAVPVQRGRG